MEESLPGFHIEGCKYLVLINIIFKKHVKFVFLANEYFTTSLIKLLYESWRGLFPALELKHVKAFGMICIESIKIETVHRPDILKPL